MKKIIEMLYGATRHASAQQIKGKKATGREDSGGYQHWQALKYGDVNRDGYSNPID